MTLLKRPACAAITSLPCFIQFAKDIETRLELKLSALDDGEI